MDILNKLSISGVNPGSMSAYGWQSEIRHSVLHSYNPATGEVIGSISPCLSEDYEVLMGRMHQAFLKWREVPAPKRGDIIRQIAQRLRREKDGLGSLVALEMGKSKQEGDGEVQEMIDIADFAVGQSRMLYGLMMHSERPGHRMYEQWHPLGIVGVISAFNFPVAVWAWNAFISAICGNVTLWKPSTKTPLCAVAVMKLCNEVLTENHCPEIFGLMIPKDERLIEQLVDDKRVSLISFTGSTPVGRKVAAKVAMRLGRSILELGGNNAIILEESADLKLAIPAIVFGAVGTAGQRCTTTRRLFVHASQYEEVLSRLKVAYQQIKIGDPLDRRNLMGPLIDQDAVQKFLKTIAQAEHLGGRVVFGGQALSRPGFYVEPTIITDVEPHQSVVQEETFAPILYVMPYDTLKEAIEWQNAVPQGLSSAIFTQNLKNAERFLSVVGSDCGIANVNIGTSGAEIGGAFGGEKDTGGGREAGSDAWKAYMRRQTNTINWSDALPLAQGIQFHLEK